MSISVKNMGKKEIRKKVLDIRNKLPETVRREKSIRIAEAVCKTRCFQEASSILVYCHFRSEAETDCLMEKAWEMGKKVYCPRVEGKEMEFYRIRSRRDLESGSFGIREPGLHCQVFDEREEHLPLVILPGAVFDWNRHRIGYGGGFYDRYLAKHPELRTAAICFEEQMQEEIPFESFDIRPDLIVTDQHCYK